MINNKNQNNGVSRRDALKLGLFGAAGLTLGSPLRALAQSGNRPKAKSVIQIWMWGGPSQIDTFDPKPDAGHDYTGPLAEAVGTNVDGIRINAALPLLAKQADKYSIIRTMTHGINGHETASYMTQTGHQPGRIVYPCAGAVVSLLKGYDQGYKGIVPPYIVLTSPQGRFSEAGFLGSKYKPFATGGNPNQSVFAVDGIVAQGISDERQKARRDLLGNLDTFGNALGDSQEMTAFDQAQGKAYEMMFGDARKIFDLSLEDDALRDRYGRSTFGQSCLAARRLVEAGVPYITINYRGWDTHKKHFETMNNKLPEMDMAMATLLEDLSQRGLLDTTIVWWSGEFGRGPKVQWEAPWNGGRSHFGNCFSAVLAGGGLDGGKIIGQSDETASNVVERPVYPHDLIRSIYTRMDIDPDGKLPNPKGLDLKVLAADAGGKKSEGILKEIM